MTILSEIQKWSEKLPTWQQHAVAVLYERPVPTAEDLEDILALLLDTHGIPDLLGRDARKLTTEQVASPQAGQPIVQLTSIKDLQYVNALAPGKVLPLAPTGLTSIYGDNGVGKSGYTRVLKKACRARDQSEPIRPNAYKHPVLAGAATAGFDALVDGKPAEYQWTDGKAAPVELSSIAIFDSRCARAYVDNQGDFSYVPYGLDILEGLAKVCAWLKERVQQEQRAAKPNVEPFAKLALSPTQAGLLAKGLSAKTRKEDIERLTTLSGEELAQLDSLVKTLGEADPKRRAADMRLKAGRVDALVQRIEAAIAVVAQPKIDSLHALVNKSNQAKSVAQVVAQRFKEMDTLEGTGDDLWLEMFRAARQFCLTSHTVHAFPRLSGEARCPLCQNQVGEAGAARLIAFDEFIGGEATKAAEKARKDAVTAFKAVVDAQLELSFDETLTHDLEASPELVDACTEFQKALRARRDAVREAAKPDSGNPWDQIPALPASPQEALAKIAAAWREAAVKLDQSQDAAARAKMEKDLAELQARRQLAELKTVALEAVDRFLTSSTLAECLAATSTTAISRKSTELTNTMATDEVAAALSEELAALGVNGISVAMQPSSTKAKTTFKLVLKSESGAVPQDILSEGEQRAIAIAAFLAEVRLSKGKGGIVFDDPVSSLDHARRERVARRIAAEAQERQVVVFTHDIFFLNVLMSEATALGLAPKALTLNQTTEGFGVAEETLPFAGANVSQRVGILRNKQVECARRFKAGDQAGYRLLARDLYNDLRMAWERGVEEVLFHEVVLRFRKGVETNRLKKVTVEPDDVTAITAGMSRCSNYTGHDGAQEANVSPPSPDEMEKDINALEAWRKSVVTRREGKK
jgi:energy-coupling factor transporter ATP-binding protein EcfA2